MAIQNRSSHIKFIQGQIKLIPIHIRLLSLSRPKPLINSLLQLHFMIWDACVILLVIVSFNFHFQSVATRIPYLTRLADPSWSPVYSDIFNQNIYFVLLNFYFQKCRDPNPRLDPVGGSMLEPGLLRHFQLSFQNRLFMLFYFKPF